MNESRPRIVFFGTPEFAAVGLRTLLDMPTLSVGAVVTQPDRPAGRGNKLHSSPVKLLAVERGIPVLQPERIRKAEQAFLDELTPFGPFDLGVVIAFGQILPQSVLDLPRRGCLNVHGSLLPRWRGAAPIQRAMMSGDAETGVCLMQMEAGLDTGPVFSESRTPIESGDTFRSLHDRLAHGGAALLRRDILSIVDGSLTSRPQPVEGVTYAHKITAADQIINWSKSADEIAHLIRALDPAPGATTFLEGRRVKLFSPEIQSTPLLPPGALDVSSGHLRIGCGTGVLAPQEAQPEGKRRMTTREWLNGVVVAPGTVLTEEIRKD